MTAPTNGLVTHYTMDNISGNTLIDEQGNNNAIISGALPVAGRSGAGNALEFLTVNDKLELSVAGLSDEITFTAWVKAYDNTNYAHLFSAPDQSYLAIKITTTYDPTSRELFLSSSGQGLVFYTTGGEDFPIDTWTHLVVTSDGTNTKLYIDGLLKESVAYAVNITGNSFVIGAGANGEFGHLVLDDVRIYNRGLSSAEVVDVYGDQSPVVTVVINESIVNDLFTVVATLVETGGNVGYETGLTQGSHDISIASNDAVYIHIYGHQGTAVKRLQTYALDARMFSPTPNTNPKYYKCTVAGATAATLPALPTTNGASVVDGGVTWECVSDMVDPIVFGPFVPS